VHSRKYIQRYYCKNCEKTFNGLTKTSLEHTTPRKAFLLLYRYFIGNYSASKIVREVQVDVKTAYLFIAKERGPFKFFQELVDSLRSH